MKPYHWDSLIGSIRHGKCILVLGPEIPVASVGRPDGGQDRSNCAEALARHLAAHLEPTDGGHAGGSLAAIAQLYEDARHLGPQRLRSSAERFYGERQEEHGPSKAHRLIAALPFSLILTTCHDNLLERALRDAGKSPQIERYHFHGDRQDNTEFMLPGSPDHPLVYGLFGDAKEPGSLVLSENDLLDFFIGMVSQRPPFPNSLLRALKGKGQSFLFVGFGIRHWHLRVLLKVLVRSLELHRSGDAVATEPLRGLTSADREETVLFYERGTRIELEDSDIEVFLARLEEKLRTVGGFAGKTSPLGSRPRVFISYAREDQALAGRVFNTLKRSHFEPWLDERSLAAGVEWDDEIRARLEASDYVLVLCTPQLCRKVDSYVNKEIKWAVERSLNLRGSFSFVLPLVAFDMAADQRIPELSKFNEARLGPGTFDEDMAKVVSTMTRDYQRRAR